MKTGPAFLLLLPACGLLVLGFLAPMAMVGRLSFFQSNFITTTFVGLGNYIEALTDGAFTRSMVNVMAYMVLIVPAAVGGSYLVAVFIEGVGKRAQNVARFAIYVPTISAGLIISIVWKWVFMRDGLADWIVGHNVGWISNPWPARIAVSVAVVTTAIGTYVIMFSAGMKAVSKELHDAARIDGASDGQYNLKIVLPLMLPMIFLVVLLALLGAMQMWETVYWMTNGGPGGYTATPIYDVYITAFNYSKHGLAAAKSVILMVAIVGVLLIKRRVGKWAE